MEATQPLDNDFGTGLTISTEIRSYLTETAKWAKFLAIVGFVYLGIVVLIALFAGSIMAMMMSGLPGAENAGGAGVVGSTFITLFYIAMALIYFFPILYLYKFATKMQTALRNDDQVFLSDAMENLKSHYKFIGILTIVSLGLAVLFMLFAIIGGAALAL